MTKLEWKRFCKFWKKHPFAYIKFIYPMEAGYILMAKAIFSKDEEDITDYDYMVENF